MAKPVNAVVGDIEIFCLICGGGWFRKREVKLNSTGLELLKLAWANESATGLICWDCGHVHLFAGRRLRVYRARK